ncbi:bacillithiol biosynthesis cysteine-adding enzyme BshC [Paraliobacillus sp. JSM ZJ581]|uniref:bacillithiol biosynthesis cysteine-adding enzyme BshC n=1 Tax=Paraliobacillus sp. JSM ZJ581 TaxID=3342118 RepID=UPI0035A8DFFD
MEIHPVTITQQPLLKDYYNQKQQIMNKFSYDPYRKETMKKRLSDIEKQTYDRNQLADVLFDLNRRWNANEMTFQHIEALRNPSSVAVIGGQQAGLLSGPLYTIHKIVSIIVFAKQQQQLLNVPVIPVFWIAGEDHDFDEIDHIMVPNNKKMKKHRIEQRILGKQPISELELDHEKVLFWLDTLFEQMEETLHSRALFDLLVKQLNQSNTYVDFFAQLIHELFAHEGLVLIDSGDDQVRKMESGCFAQLINHQPNISKQVYQQLQSVKQEGYSVSIDVDENDAHLFYHVNGERVLLIKDTEGRWVGKNGECRLTTNELLQIAEKSPERLSNNVVTRPVIQEWLFPTLAFMAGPGELGYWSVLKPAFQALGLNMPPVYPRLSLTIINRKNENFSKQFDMPIDEVINKGVQLKKMNWLAMQQHPPLNALVDQLSISVDQMHQPLRKIASSYGPDLEDLANKNLAYIQDHIQFLQKAIDKEITKKNQHVIDKFDNMEVMLHPENGLQERCWNIIYFINQYGFDWLKNLTDYPYSFLENHYVVKI